MYCQTLLCYVLSYEVDICSILPRGYYPKGGGEVIVRMSPVKQLDPINLTDRGSVTKIYGRAFVAGVLPLKVSCLSAVYEHLDITTTLNFFRILCFSFKIRVSANLRFCLINFLPL